MRPPDQPAQPAHDPFGGPPGGEHIGLDFGERDRASGERTVVVENRVMAVFPALIGEALNGPPPVFDESVPISVAVGLDPAERGLYVRPEAPARLDIVGAVEIFPRQHHEQRRRIDAAVIPAERDLA